MTATSQQLQGWLYAKENEHLRIQGGQESLRFREAGQILRRARKRRVLVFTAPSRPIGIPVAVEGAYWMRAGEDLTPMTPDMLRRIFDEAVPDYSAEICRNATLADLDPDAIESLRTRWARHSANKALAKRPVDKLLRDAELILPNGVTTTRPPVLCKNLHKQPSQPTTRQ